MGVGVGLGVGDGVSVVVAAGVDVGVDLGLSCLGPPRCDRVALSRTTSHVRAMIPGHTSYRSMATPSAIECRSLDGHGPESAQSCGLFRR